MKTETYKQAKRILNAHKDFLNGAYKNDVAEIGYYNGLYNMLRSVLLDEKNGMTKQDAWNNALFFLNGEQEHLNRQDNPKIQYKAFIEGLRIMLDVIVREGFTEHNGLYRTKKGLWEIEKEAV